MNVKVVQSFADRHTGTIHMVGEEITVTKERCGEINATSLFVEETKKPKK